MVCGSVTAALLCLGLARPAAAGRDLVADGSVTAPAPGARLVAGTTTEIRWSGLPPAVEEFELLLSLDGGDSFPVRLTPQLDPATRRLEWQVPDLPVRGARLRLRVGIDGREIESVPSGRFDIVGGVAGTAAPLRYWQGEWWTAATPGPSSPERLAPERRLRPDSGSHLESAIGLLPDDGHQLTFSLADAPLAPPAARLERPAPAAWSNPTRPVAPTQRE